ncbi:MAG: class I SAM-dependent methyltransferase [Rhizobiales bacterium]|nr:class I SAM-dependent methyltransferase [Hyphomicrobiales bacterium]
MIEVVHVDRCVACGSKELRPAFAREDQRHTSLARLSGELPEGVDPAFLSTFTKIGWRICEHCGVIFAGNRPPAHGCESWYLPMFKLSEERGYDVSPLPESYVRGKAAGGAVLYGVLKERGLIARGARILHIRCATGELLRLAKENDGADVWGFDFFPSCVAHANEALGEDRVKLLEGPNPRISDCGVKFDLIVSNHMITHAHDPKLLALDLRGSLADGGALVTCNEPDHAKTLKSFRSYRRGINFFHKQLFSEETFVSSMRRWGYELERIAGTGGRARKLEKYMMFICRKSEPTHGPAGSAAKSAGLLRSWERRRRVAELLRLV